MAPKKTDDLLALTGRIYSLETSLLDRSRAARILGASTDEEAFELLAECGYPRALAANGEALEASLRDGFEQTLLDMAKAAPESAVPELFRLRRDYHNAKALVKGVSDPGILLGGGRVSPEKLSDAIVSGDLKALPGRLPQAIAEAAKALAETGDGRLCSMLLDRECYAELRELSKRCDAFTAGYIALTVDSNNLRAFVRVSRRGADVSLLEKAVFDGGSVSRARVIDAFSRENPAAALVELYSSTLLADAVTECQAALDGGAFTALEKACTAAITRYISQAKTVSFGEPVLLRYLYARDAEVSALRLLLSGRLSGLSNDVITERLGENYG